MNLTRKSIWDMIDQGIAGSNVDLVLSGGDCKVMKLSDETGEGIMTITKGAPSRMLKDCPDVLNIDEMCAALGICTKTGYRLLRDGSIVSRKVGRKYCIPKAHLLAYLKMNSAVG